MPALQFLRLSDLLETDDARVVHTSWEIFWGIHIWKPLQLRYQLSRLNEQLDWFPKSDKSIYDLTEKIQRKLLSRDYVHEKFDIEEEHDEIEEEWDDVEHEPLLCPLLSMMQLKQGDSVLEVVLDGFQQQPHKLYKHVSMQPSSYFKSNDNVDLIHFLSAVLESFIKSVCNDKVSKDQDHV